MVKKEGLRNVAKAGASAISWAEVKLPALPGGKNCTTRRQVEDSKRSPKLSISAGNDDENRSDDCRSDGKKVGKRRHFLKEVYDLPGKSPKKLRFDCISPPYFFYRFQSG